MKNQKPVDQSSLLSRILRQPRYAVLAFVGASVVVAGAGLVVKNLSQGDAPINASGFSEGPATALERPAEPELAPGVDSTDMATFGERAAEKVSDSGGEIPAAPQSQGNAEKTETPLVEFPTGPNPGKLTLRQGQGGGGGSGASASAPSLGGVFERMSSLAGRAFNGSQAFVRSFGGKSRDASASGNQTGSTGQTKTPTETAASNLGSKTSVNNTRGSGISNLPGYRIDPGGTNLGGHGALDAPGPKDKTPGGGGGGGSSGGGGGGSNSPSSSTTTANGTVTGNDTLVRALEDLNNAFDKLSKECGQKTWDKKPSEKCEKLRAEVEAASNRVYQLLAQASPELKVLLGKIIETCGPGFWMGEAKAPAASAKNCNSAIEVALAAAKKEEIKTSSEAGNGDADAVLALEELSKAYADLRAKCEKEWGKSDSAVDEECKKLQDAVVAARKKVVDLFPGTSGGVQNKIATMLGHCGEGFWMRNKENADKCGNALKSALTTAKDAVAAANKEEDKNNDTSTEKENVGGDANAMLALEELSKAYADLRAKCEKEWGKSDSAVDEECKKLQDAVVAARKKVVDLFSGTSGGVQNKIATMLGHCGEGFWMRNKANADLCGDALKNALKTVKKAEEEKAADKASSDIKTDKDDEEGEKQEDTALNALKTLGEAFANLKEKCEKKWDKPISPDDKVCNDLRAKTVVARARVDALYDDAPLEVKVQIKAMREHCGKGYWMGKAENAGKCKNAIAGALAAAEGAAKTTDVAEDDSKSKGENSVSPEEIADLKQKLEEAIKKEKTACLGQHNSGSKGCKSAQKLTTETRQKLEDAENAYANSGESVDTTDHLISPAEAQELVRILKEAENNKNLKCGYSPHTSQTEACADATREFSIAQKNVSLAEKAADEAVEAAEKIRDSASAKKTHACGASYRNKPKSETECAQAKSDLAAAEEKLLNAKEARPSGCIDYWSWACAMKALNDTKTDLGEAIDTRTEEEKAKGTEEEKKKVRGDERKAADEAIASGLYTECRSVIGEKGNEFRCKEKGKDGEVKVSATVFSAFNRARREKKKENEKKEENTAGDAKTGEEKLSQEVKKIWKVSDSLDLARTLGNELKDKKWANRGKDKNLDIQYQERQRLVQALRQNPYKNPIEVYKSLRLTNTVETMDVLAKKFEKDGTKLHGFGQKNSTPIAENSSNSYKKPTAPKRTLTQETNKPGSNREGKLIFVTPAGTPTGATVYDCSPSQLRGHGVCQDVGTSEDFPVAVFVGPKGSPTGWMFKEKCGANEKLTITNTPLKGRGKCERK